METTKGEEQQAKDNLEKSEKNDESSHNESDNKTQDKHQGASSSVDVENHPAFKDAREAIAMFDLHANQLIEDNEHPEMGCERPLKVVDDLHNEALTVVRKAIEVDKEEGDKLKAVLRDSWQVSRHYFTEHVDEVDSYELNYSDPDLNPYSPLRYWERWGKEEE